MAVGRPPPAGVHGQQPFFVVGSDRSGTTLLRLYLDAHSQLAIPSESWFLIDLLAAFESGRTAGSLDEPERGPPRVLDADDLERALAMVTQHRRFREGWHVAPDAVRLHLDGVAEPTLADFIEALYRLETRLPPGGRWGDKTPEYALHMGELARVFPGSQFVHIVRDGRDVYLSLASKKWRDRGHTPYELGRYWSRAVSTAGAAGEQLGSGRYLLVKYEDLVLDTRATLVRVTDFLGVGFEEGMLAAHGEAAKVVTPRESAAGVHDKLFRAPRSTDVARWRESSSKPGVMLAAGVMREQLHAYDYPDPPTAPTAFITRNLAAYHHLAQRYLVPRVRRRLAKARKPTTRA